MAHITVEEPKSITEEVTKYECDSCGYRSGDSEEFNTDFRFDGATEDIPTTNRGTITNPFRDFDVDDADIFHLCGECSGGDQHASYMDKVDKRKHRVRNFVAGMSVSYTGLWTLVGSMATFLVYGTIQSSKLSPQTSHIGSLVSSFIISLFFMVISVLITGFVLIIIGGLLDRYGYDEVELTKPSLKFK